MKKNETIQAAIFEALPLAIAIATYGLSYGVLAVSAKLSLFEIMLMSLTVFSGSVQLIVVAMLLTGAAYGNILVTVILLNVRNLLYGASLASGLKGAGRWKYLLAFGVSDEPFVLGQSRFSKVGPDPLYYGVITLLFYSAWQISSLAGAVIGNQLDPLKWGLDLAFPMTFTALLVPSLKGRPILASALGAVVISGTLFYFMPQSQLNVAITGLLAPLIGVIASRGGEND